MSNRARPRNVFRSWNVYCPLRVDGDGGKCIQYNSYRTNHIWIRILHFAGWSREAFLLWLSGDPAAIFLLVNTGCSCWLIFVPRSPSCLRTTSADFWCLNANVIRTGLSDGVWTGSLGCWRRLIAELMSFSGYFNFKNISLKFLHSCERKRKARKPIRKWQTTTHQKLRGYCTGMWT